MKTYKIPTKTVVMVDREKMLVDLRKGPIYLDKADHSHIKAFEMHLRNTQQEVRVSFKALTVLTDGKEQSVLRVTLTDTPVREYRTRAGVQVFRVVDGLAYRSLSAACKENGLKYTTVLSKMKKGKSLLESSEGLFTKEQP